MAKRRPKPGDMVVLMKVPPGLIDGLPREDQRAISDVVGKPILLVEYREDGKAELKFQDQEGGIHFIYVSPAFIKLPLRSD